MLNQMVLKKNQMRAETIASVNEFLSDLDNDANCITASAIYSSLNTTLRNLDSWLDFKWNFLMHIVSKNQNNLKYASCKDFFKDETNTSKMSSIIIGKEFSNLSARLTILGACFVISDENKIDVQQIYGKLKNDQLVELEADDAFIKFCKGMYRWSQPGLDIKKLFESYLFKKAINQFFK